MDVKYDPERKIFNMYGLRHTIDDVNYEINHPDSQEDDLSDQ